MDLRPITLATLLGLLNVPMAFGQVLTWPATVVEEPVYLMPANLSATPPAPVLPGPYVSQGIVPTPGLKISLEIAGNRKNSSKEKKDYYCLPFKSLQGQPFEQVMNCHLLLDTWTALIRNGTIDPVVLNNRGVGYLEMDRVDPLEKDSAEGDPGRTLEAIGDFDRAIQLNPHYAAAYFNRGAANLHLKNHRRALADFFDALRLDPGDPNAYIGRGLAFYRIDRYSRAVEDFTRALRLLPPSDPAKEFATKARDLALCKMNPDADYKGCINGIWGFLNTFKSWLCTDAEPASNADDKERENAIRDILSVIKSLTDAMAERSGKPSTIRDAYSQAAVADADARTAEARAREAEAQAREAEAQARVEKARLEVQRYQAERDAISSSSEARVQGELTKARIEEAAARAKEAAARAKEAAARAEEAVARAEKARLEARKARLGIETKPDPKQSGPPEKEAEKKSAN